MTLDDRLRAEREAYFAAIDVHDGSAWLVDRRMSLHAIEAERLVRERRDEAFARYKSTLDEAIACAGYRVRPTENEELRRENLYAEWGDQIIDVLVPLAHPAVPSTGRVKVVNGEVVIDTATRDDLAQRMGVMFPETIDERVARRLALDEAHQRAQQRADELAEHARRAADEVHTARK